MKSRSAIILSLGMLLDNVDTNGFIMQLLAQAKKENADFAFTPDIQKQAFELSEAFNKGEILTDKFETDLLRLLGIKTMESEAFWERWNAMVRVGDIDQRIQMLKDAGNAHNALVYLYSDTNSAHLQKIAEACLGNKTRLDMTQRPMLLDQFPLFVSCQTRKNRHELIKHVAITIQGKAANKPDSVSLILGNPDNIANKAHQASARKELDAIAAWCKENQIAVTLHNGNLQETLDTHFTCERTASMALTS